MRLTIAPKLICILLDLLAGVLYALYVYMFYNQVLSV